MIKKILYISICLGAHFSAIAQTPTISGSLNGTFVEGFSPVNNLITITDDGGAVTANFIAFNSAGEEVFSFTDSDATDGLTWESDMGLLSPGAYISAILLDDNGDTLSQTENLDLTILAKPQWLVNGSGTVTVVNVIDNIINFDASLNLTACDGILPSNIPGLGGRGFNIENPKFKINVDYDISAAPSASTFNNKSVNFTLDVFGGQFTRDFAEPINDTLADFQLDDSLNFLINASLNQNIPGFKINFPLARFPLAALPVIIKVDGGLEISVDIKAQLVFGHDSSTNSWGFIQGATSSDITKLIGKINGNSFLRVTADAVIASASGSVEIRGSIGAGLGYTTVGGAQTLFGGELEISGSLNYKIGRGWWTLHEGEVKKTFYKNTFGDTAAYHMPYGSNLIFEQPHVNAMGGYTWLIQDNPGLEPQKFYAQPAFSANDSSLYITWLDFDENDKTMILLSELDYTSGQFLAPETVINNKDIITNPKVAILPSGSCLLSWTQGRCTSDNFDTTSMNMHTIAKSQDIWLAYYDKSTNTMGSPIMLSDDFDSDTSGRAEGNANIIMGKGNYGIITWISADLTNNTSDVYYSTITLAGSTINFSEPAIFSTESGIDKSVNVAFYDSTHVIASWINDPDATDSTANNLVKYRKFDISEEQSNWNSPEILIPTDNSTQYEDLSMDFNGEYGAIAFTSTHYEINGDFKKNIHAVAWSDNAWSTPFFDGDTSYYFLKPHVSVNNAGITALTYQAIELYGDTLNPDEGVMYMYTNNFITNPDVWTSYEDSMTLGDPGIYTEDIQTSYAYNNYLLAISQESDPVTGLAPEITPNGVRFGSDGLNLVLRAFTVSGSSSPIGENEPETEPTTNIKQIQPAFGELLIYPNPTSGIINLRFSNAKRTNVKIELFDINGSLVSTIMNTVLAPGLYQTIYEPERIDNGLYIIKITTDKGFSNSKVSIIK